MSFKPKAAWSAANRPIGYGYIRSSGRNAAVRRNHAAGRQNEALQVICATLLTPEKVTIRNIPAIVDVMQLIELLRRHGRSRRADRREHLFVRGPRHRFRLSAKRGLPPASRPTARFGNDYRPAAGPLRRGLYSQAGGDKIGRRRLDTHFLGFQKLGASSTSIREPISFPSRAAA